MTIGHLIELLRVYPPETVVEVIADGGRHYPVSGVTAFREGAFSPYFAAIVPDLKEPMLPIDAPPAPPPAPVRPFDPSEKPR